MTTGTTTAPPTAKARTPQRANHPRSNRLPLILVIPTLVLLIAALGYPIGWQVVTSFKQYGLMQQFGAPAPFVGLDNYTALVTDPYLWTVVVRSVVFCVVTALVTVAIGGAMAVLMNALTTWPRIVLQVALLVAWAMPVVAAMTVWIWIVDWRRGLLNWALVRLGVDGAEGHNWLAEPLSFFVVASVIIVWMSVPFVAFTVYAALTQVPEELIESAEIDGASPTQRMRHIVFPSIRPVLMVVGLLQVIWDLRVFSQIFILQKAGGNTHDTNLLGTYIYRLGIGGGQFGMAAAVAIFMLGLTVIVTAPYVRAMLKQEREA